MTADDGMTDYGTAVDKIALRSDALCRKYREITPPVDEWCWNLTPWTCDASNSCNVRSVYSSGAMSWYYAYHGRRGVRPLCYPKSVILVSIPGEAGDEVERAALSEEMRLKATEAILSTLNDYPVAAWGPALAGAVTALFQSKLAAEEIAQEEAGKKAVEG